MKYVCSQAVARKEVFLSAKPDDGYMLMRYAPESLRLDAEFILAAAGKVNDPANHLHYADVSKVFRYTLPETRFEEVDFMRKAVAIMASAVHFAASKPNSNPPNLNMFV